MSMNHLELSKDDRVGILKVVFQEMHTQRRTAAALENKVEFGFGTLLLAFAAFIVKGDIDVTLSTKVVSGYFVVATCTIAIWFLVRNGNLIRIQCRMLVRIEQTLELFEEGAYVSKEFVARYEDQPFPEPTVFPKTTLMWGTTDKWQTVTPHIVGITAVGFAALLAIVFA